MVNDVKKMERAWNNYDTYLFLLLDGGGVHAGLVGCSGNFRKDYL